jgi:hypothetical protein
MKKSVPRKSLLDGYRFAGFRGRSKIKGCFGDSTSLVISLSRRQKKQFVELAQPALKVGMIARRSKPVILAVAIAAFIWNLRSAVYFAGNVRA